MRTLKIFLFVTIISVLAACSSDTENKSSEDVESHNEEVSDQQEEHLKTEVSIDQHKIPPYYESHLRIDELEFNQNITFRVYEGLYYTEGPFNSSYAYSFYGYVNDDTIAVNELLDGSQNHSSSIYYRVLEGEQIILPGNIVAEIVKIVPPRNEITLKFIPNE